VRVRLSGLAISTWATLAAEVERQTGQGIVPRQLFLSRADYETLRAAETARDAEAARAFFRPRIGPSVAPLLQAGTALYETYYQTKGNE
jgi:hypothetical protein